MEGCLLHQPRPFRTSGDVLWPYQLPSHFPSPNELDFLRPDCRSKVAVYLDDILIFTITLEEHRTIVNEVLQHLKAHDLYLRPEKCEFEQEKIEYLGLVIKEGEVHMDPSKVEAVRTWPTPRTLQEA